MRHSHYIIALAVSLVCAVQCSCTGLHSSRETVARADTLLSAGEMYEDSTSLAEAARTLNPWRVVDPNAYAHACFHYGRLLRTREHYAVAMTYLLHAIHSRSGDQHMLGRAYSNIAYICRLEGSYDLSQTMYRHSSEAFLRAGDTLRYHIGCINAAYALAERGDTSGVRALLQPTEQSYHTELLRDMISETLAEAYMRAGEYAGAMQAASRIAAPTPSVMMIKAQCFSQTGQYDSATFYARRVMEQSSFPFMQANALFILTQQDSSADMSDVRAAASQRALVLEHIADNQGELSRAVELLEQDRRANKTHPATWLLVGVICIVAGLTVVVRRYQSHQQQVAAQLAETHRQEQNARLQIQLTQRQEQIKSEVERTIAALQHARDWQQTLGWNDYDQFVAIVNRQFFLLADKLYAIGELSEKETRLCILVLMNCFSSRQMAALLHYGESGIRNFKQHTANKLGTTSRDMREHLLHIIIGEN